MPQPPTQAAQIAAAIADKYRSRAVRLYLEADPNYPTKSSKEHTVSGPKLAALKADLLAEFAADTTRQRATKEQNERLLLSWSNAPFLLRNYPIELLYYQPLTSFETPLGAVVVLPVSTSTLQRTTRAARRLATMYRTNPVTPTTALAEEGFALLTASASATARSLSASEWDLFAALYASTEEDSPTENTTLRQHTEKTLRLVTDLRRITNHA